MAEFFDDADLIVTYNGKTFDVPVMETRWPFHRMEMPLDGVPHFDMLHPARRLWKNAGARADGCDDAGCRLSTLERTLFDVQRVGDVPGFEIPGRFFGFVRSGDPRPLEPVLEHNRIDLVSLAAVMARAVRLARDGHEALPRLRRSAGARQDLREARSMTRPRRSLLSPRVRIRPNRWSAPKRCTGSASGCGATGGSPMPRRSWRELIEFTEPRSMRRGLLGDLRQVAVEALAIHHEHRAKDLAGARELALASLEESAARPEKRPSPARPARPEAREENRDPALFLTALLTGALVGAL